MGHRHQETEIQKDPAAGQGLNQTAFGTSPPTAAPTAAPAHRSDPTANHTAAGQFNNPVTTARVTAIR